MVLTHASTSLFNREGALIHFSIGASGVDLFFVISGFIMYHTTADGSKGAVDFALRRVVRICPLYYIMTTFAFVLALLFPEAFNTLSPSKSDFIRSILFIPYYNFKTHVIQPEVGQGWTLNFEMFFYAIFTGGLVLRQHIRIIFFAFILILLSILGALLQPSNPVIATYTDSIIMEFLFGIIIGYAVSLASDTFGRYLFGFFLAGGALIAIAYLFAWQSEVQPNIPRFLLAGIPASAIVTGAVLLERGGHIPESPALLLLGNASYSLYLCHGFVLGALRRVWSRLFDLHLVLTHAFFFVAGLTISIAAAIVIYVYLERPLTRFLFAIVTKRSTQTRSQPLPAPR